MGMERRLCFYRGVVGVASSTVSAREMIPYVSIIKFINPKSTVTHGASLSLPYEDTQLRSLRLPFSYSMIDKFVLTHTSCHFAVY